LVRRRFARNCEQAHRGVKIALKRLVAPACLVSTAAGAQVPAPTLKNIAAVLRYEDRNVGHGPSVAARRAALIARYVSENSNGRTTVHNTSVPIAVTVPQTQPVGACRAPSFDAVQAGLRAAGYSLADYDTAFFIVPASTGGCRGGIAGWNALTDPSTGKRKVVRVAYLYNPSEVYSVHEYMHLLGLPHASTLKCGSDALGLVCSVNEYGNQWDVMGKPNVVFGIGAPFRARLGWTTPIVHDAGDATYTIGPACQHERPNAIRLKLAPPNRGDVVEAAAGHLWIEWRRPCGWDSPFSAHPELANGAFITLSGQYSHRTAGGRTSTIPCAQRSCLLDMTPGDSTLRNATLPVGAEFVHSWTGTRVRVVDQSADGLTVTVSVPR
jgi:hypothetical protein